LKEYFTLTGSNNQPFSPHPIPLPEGEGVKIGSAVDMYCFYGTGSLSPSISDGRRASRKIPAGFCGSKSKYGQRHI